MKKASVLLATLFVLSAAPMLSNTAEAQSRTQARGKVTKTTKKTTRTTRTTRQHRTHRSHHGQHRTHRHGHHRSSAYVHFGWPYTHHYVHRPHYVHRSTVIYDRTPDVVVVEAEPQFTMPGLECPIRTREERSGLQQWCATGRGTKHGLYRRWYDDGVLAAEGEYAYDLQTGVWVEYHPNGAIREEGEYHDGKRIGTWVTWGSDGEELVVVDY